MPLINLLRLKKSYTIKVKCGNCKYMQELNIPKQKQIAEYIKSEEAQCDNCGCACLQTLS